MHLGPCQRDPWDHLIGLVPGGRVVDDDSGARGQAVLGEQVVTPQVRSVQQRGDERHAGCCDDPENPDHIGPVAHPYSGRPSSRARRRGLFVDLRFSGRPTDTDSHRPGW